MQGLKYSSVICLLLGFFAIIYGWTQTWGFGARSSEYQQILIERTVKTYVFIVGGVILIIVSFVVDQIIKALKDK